MAFIKRSVISSILLKNQNILKMKDVINLTGFLLPWETCKMCLYK